MTRQRKNKSNTQNNQPAKKNKQKRLASAEKLIDLSSFKDDMERSSVPQGSAAKSSSSTAANKRTRVSKETDMETDISEPLPSGSSVPSLEKKDIVVILVANDQHTAQSPRS